MTVVGVLVDLGCGPPRGFGNEADVPDPRGANWHA